MPYRGEVDPILGDYAEAHLAPLHGVVWIAWVDSLIDSFHAGKDFADDSPEMKFIAGQGCHKLASPSNRVGTHTPSDSRLLS